MINDLKKIIPTNEMTFDLNYRNLFKKYDIHIFSIKDRSKLTIILSAIKPLNYIILNNNTMLIITFKNKLSSIHTTATESDFIKNARKLTTERELMDLPYHKKMSLIINGLVSSNNGVEGLFLPITNVKYNNNGIYFFSSVDHTERKNRIYTVCISFEQFSINSCLVNMSSVSFKKITKDEKKESGIKVFLDKNNKLRYAGEDIIKNKEIDIYKQGNFRNQKHIVDFFVRDKKDFFNKEHKIKYLYYFFKELDRYSDIVKYRFNTKKVSYKERKYTQEVKTINNEVTSLLNKFDTVYITNKTDIDNKLLIDNFTLLSGEKGLKETIDIKFKIVDKPVVDKFNLIIINDKNYYNKKEILEDDPYKDLKNDDPYSQLITKQNIILKNGKIKLWKYLKPILFVALKELLLKQDIKNKQITAINKKVKLKRVGEIYKKEYKVDCPQCGDSENKEKIISEKWIRELSFTKDGKMEFSNKKLSKEDANNINIVIKDNVGLMIIEDFDNNINYIKDSKFTTLPNLKKINKVLNNKNEKCRFITRAKKNIDCFNVGYSLMDFKYFLTRDAESNYTFHYSSGQHDNVNATISKNYPFKEVIKATFKDKLLSGEILKATETFVIKYKDYTSYPFYFKYLRLFDEIEKIKNYQKK